MKARLFHVLLAVIAFTGLLIAGLVARSEASSPSAGASAAQHASPFSVPF